MSQTKIVSQYIPRLLLGVQVQGEQSICSRSKVSGFISKEEGMASMESIDVAVTHR